ncbi:hypothetical protein E3N88_10314 [Mikania micrantha]|uniref:Protein RER1 n=1 Tax=Mikania micrantha TaxID=192012 RepID=A0A5N6PAF8_9ASTR|nr:hypothetical protein E3N88_10314 [Mikania micrantha]
MNVGGVADTDLKSSPLSEWTHTLSRRYQHILDKSTPHVLHRWIGFAVVVFIYALRVYFVQGFYIVTYGLGIYILQLFLAFLSPQVDPELQDGPSLPTRGSEEFRPFVRRLPEFKFWFVDDVKLLGYVIGRSLWMLIRHKSVRRLMQHECFKTDLGQQC